MKNKFDAELQYSAMKKTMGLSIEDQWKESVLQHLNIAADMAELLSKAPISDKELELANVYIPNHASKEKKADQT